MMRNLPVLPLAGILVIMSAGLTVAQSSGLGAKPAETPPASFSARYYVDSRGCMFVRAGSGGATNWVPRVNRNREQICGFAPSLAGAQPAPAPVAATTSVQAASTQPARAATVTVIPAGYKAAWTDGRLNPNRGPRTAQGDAAMAEVWDTSKQPMRRK